MEPKINFNYRKLTSEDAGYYLVKTARENGMWACDSYDHNELEGCSNPDCFKYNQKEEKHGV